MLNSLREAGVGGSNPLTPTNKTRRPRAPLFVFGGLSQMLFVPTGRPLRHASYGGSHASLMRKGTLDVCRASRDVTTSFSSQRGSC